MAVHLFGCIVFFHDSPFIQFFFGCFLPRRFRMCWTAGKIMYVTFYLLIIVSISVNLGFPEIRRIELCNISLFNARCSTILSEAGCLDHSWKAGFQLSGVRTVNSRFLLTKFHRLQCYSSKKPSGARSSRKCDHKQLMTDMEEFFVVRKGDVAGVYKSLSDCDFVDQSGPQIASSIP